jgi:hypothetical protein
VSSTSRIGARFHAVSLTPLPALGHSTKTVAPEPSVDSAQMRPSIFSTTFFTMANPAPVPFELLLPYQPVEEAKDAVVFPAARADRVITRLTHSGSRIDVDTKKKELVGNFKNAGQEWQLVSLAKCERSPSEARSVARRDYCLSKAPRGRRRP